MADISTEELERIEREYHSGSDNIKPIQEFSPNKYSILQMKN